jgi:hypothetical protein
MLTQGSDYTNPASSTNYTTPTHTPQHTTRLHAEYLPCAVVFTLAPAASDTNYALDPRSVHPSTSYAVPTHATTNEPKRARRPSIRTRSLSSTAG